MASAQDAAAPSAVARTSSVIADTLAVDRVGAAPNDAVNLFITDYDNNAGRVAGIVTSPARAVAARATTAAASAAALAGNEVRRLCPSKLPASTGRSDAAPFPTWKRSKGTSPPLRLSLLAAAASIATAVGADPRDDDSPQSITDAALDPAAPAKKMPSPSPYC